MNKSIYEIKDLQCLKAAELPNYIEARAIKRNIILQKIKVKSGWVSDRISFVATGDEENMKLFKNDLQFFEDSYNKALGSVSKKATLKM